MSAAGDLTRAADRPPSAEDRTQLDWEARAGRPAAAAAFAAALLPLIGTIISATAIGTTDGEAAQFLVAVDDAAVGAIAGAVVTALGLALLPVALGYLYRATAARRPETPSIALPLLIAAAIGLGIVLVVQQIFVLDVAGDFTAGSDRSEEAAEDLLEESGLQATGYVDAGLRVGLGVAIVLISLNAMRAGLLGRFMGIIGIGVGAFYAIPVLVEPTLIQLFWGISLGLLFLGRWPGGERGPAWSRVEAIPWPSTAERMAAQQRDQAGAGDASAGEPAPEAGSDDAPSEGDRPDPRPASRKRRRGR